MLVAIHLLPLLSFLLLSFCVQSGLAQNSETVPTSIVNSSNPYNETMFLAARNAVNSSVFMVEFCDETYLCSWTRTKTNQIVLSDTSLALTYFLKEKNASENLKLTPQLRTPKTKLKTQQFHYNAATLTFVSAFNRHHVLDILNQNLTDYDVVGVKETDQSWNQKFYLMGKPILSPGPALAPMH